MAERTSGDLVLSAVTKTYDTFTAVDNIDLTIPQGSFFALLGPSGCGKTTTLRMVAGLEQPTVGSISIGARDITATKPYQRNVNTVFQNYALFPHLDILENVAFGLKRRGVRDWKAKAMEALELVELAQVARKKPTQLSGGMQQRVALARAVVNRPDVLLLDEPLGALDLKLRRQMQIELKRIQQEVGLTFVHVTHDQEEAMTMADTIAVMNAGRLQQVGDPGTLYEKPQSTFAANFLGQSNLLRATVSGVSGEMASLDVHGIPMALPASSLPGSGAELWLGIRPEKVRLLGDSSDTTGLNTLKGEVTDVSFLGVATQYLVAMPWGRELTVVQQNDGMPRAALGTNVTLGWVPENSFALDASQDADAGVDSVEDE
ncbi:ABC transporter ATP-binding protein [Terrabacter lapilli]|uniref:ABC transporter ATP-binding protein n=1 Tax=Terrabacter lapilli TaxID=436231 RepID=A0ABN2RIV2_9MICO|nr:ABC transporter ATP-binding protein [Terrabacter sp.]